MPAMAMLHNTDPREKLMDQVGDLSAFEVFHNKVLCAIYMRPNITAKGIYLTDAAADEDRHQGKVGLIVKVGAQAFQDPDGAWTWADDMGVGDWVYYRASDGWAVTIIGPHGDKIPCRVLDDINIQGRIPSPDQVW